MNKVDSDIVQLYYVVINKAYEVMNFFKKGLQESAYHAALEWELQNAGVRFETEQPFHIWYKGHRLDKMYKIDLVVNGNVIVELKAKEEITAEHRLQLFNYMRLTNLPFGLLINFSTNGTLSAERYFYDTTTNVITLFDRKGTLLPPLK